MTATVGEFDRPPIHEAFEQAFKEAASQDNEGYVPDRGGFKCGFFAAWRMRDAELSALSDERDDLTRKLLAFGGPGAAQIYGLTDCAACKTLTPDYYFVGKSQICASCYRDFPKLLEKGERLERDVADLRTELEEGIRVATCAMGDIATERTGEDDTIGMLRRWSAAASKTADKIRSGG